MKKLLLTFLAFTAGFLPLAAQDWAPFKMGRTPYFQAGDSIYSLRITDVYVQGNNSVFEFNPRVVPTDASMYQAKRSYNNIFGHKMLKSNDGDFRFVFSTTDTFLLKPKASVGESWLFSQSSGLTATVQSKTFGTVQNSPDSVVTIEISNGNLITISKNYGLLNARSFYSYITSVSATAPLTLIRLPEVGMGTALHHPFTIYDYQPGDKFLREGIYKIGFPPCYKYWETTEVLSRNQNADSIWYQIRKQVLKVGVAGWPCTVPNGAELSDFDTIRFVVHAAAMPWLFDLSNEYAPKPASPSQFHLPNLGQFVSNYNGRLGTHFELMFLADSAAGLYQSAIDGAGANQYAEGLGLINSYSDHGGQETLIAYIKGTETYGNWQPLVLSAEDELLANPVQIFPNPFTNELTLKLPEQAPAEITIYNLQGQKIRALQTNSEANLQLPDLPAGLYLLQVQQGEKSYTTKIQKQ